MPKKKMSIAEFKRSCGLLKRDLEGYSYQCIIRAYKGNADACLEQGYLTEKSHAKAIDAGRAMADSIHFGR